MRMTLGLVMRMIILRVLLPFKKEKKQAACVTQSNKPFVLLKEARAHNPSGYGPLTGGLREMEI